MRLQPQRTSGVRSGRARKHEACADQMHRHSPRLHATCATSWANLCFKADRLRRTVKKFSHAVRHHQDTDDNDTSVSCTRAFATITYAAPMLVALDPAACHRSNAVVSCDRETRRFELRRSHSSRSFVRGVCASTRDRWRWWHLKWHHVCADVSDA
jgi:hypothetical protein